jgi:glutathione S-transferase
MTQLILHHYDGSPFAEKIRLMLGYKGMAWQSVKIPVIMPKPDVVALTGGYRRTPIVQLGADVYCDTALIAQLLEQLAPTPSLFPTSAPTAPLLAQWADSTLFWTVIPYSMQPAGMASIFAGVPPEVLKAFGADRAPFSASIKRQTAVDATANLSGYLTTLEAQLADGRQFLFGEMATVADFSVAQCLWYVRRAGPLAEIVSRNAKLDAWLTRMLAIGHGTPSALSSEAALQVAASATAHAPTSVGSGLGFEAGQAVTVTPTDYGMDPVAGTLVGLSLEEVVIARTDARAGTVHVHFPRRGYQVKQEAA